MRRKSFKFFTLLNIATSFAQIALLHSSFAIPPISEIKKHCPFVDMAAANLLSIQLQECKFEGQDLDLIKPSTFTVCLESTAQTSSRIDSKECQEFFWEDLRAIHKSHLIRHTKRLKKDVSLPQFSKESLTQVLNHVNLWITSLSFAYDHHPDQARRDTRQVLSSLWTQVWTSLHSPDHVIRSEQTFSEGLPKISQLIEIGTEIHLKPAIMFPLMEHALTQLNQRIEFFTDLAEISCSFLRCSTQRMRQSHIFRLNQLLSQIDQPSAISDEDLVAIDLDSTFDVQSQKTIMQFFKTYVKTAQVYHREYEGKNTSNADPTPASKSILHMAGLDVPDYARGYFLVLKNCINRASAFTQVVQAQSPIAPVLKIGLTNQNISQVPDTLARLADELKQSATEYQRLKDNLANIIQQENTQTVQKRLIEKRLLDDEEERNHLLSDLLGLQSKLMSHESLFQRQKSDALKLLNSDLWKAKHGSTFQTAENKQLNIRASNARFAGQPAKDLRVQDIAISNISINAKSGDALNISVSGTWSPSCALKKEGYKFDAPVKIGPEGFVVSDSKSKLQVTSDSQNTSTRTFDQSQSTRGKDNRQFRNETSSSATVNTEGWQKSQTTTNNCQTGTRASKTKAYVNDERKSASVSVGFNFGGFSCGGSESRTMPGYVHTDSVDSFTTMDKTDSFSSSSTQSGQKSQTQETSSGTQSGTFFSSQDSSGVETSKTALNGFTESDETRSSASFYSGLRSQFAPFRDLPVGSLLLVQADRYNQIIDIQVVRSPLVKLVDQDSRFYFVVNDCEGEETKDDQLTVHYLHQRPTHQEASQIIGKTLHALRDIEQKGQTYLKTGNVTPLQLRELETEVESILAQSGRDITDIPLLKSLYQNWVSGTLSQLDLRIKILQAERKVPPLQRRIHQHVSDLQDLDRNLEVSQLSQIWALDNLDLVKLGKSLKDMCSSLQLEILPVLKVRYLDALAEAGTRIAPLVESFNPDSSLLKLNQAFQDLLRDLSTRIRQLRLQEALQEQTIVIRFPKLDGPEYDCNPGNNGMCPYSSPLAAYSVWTAIQNAATPLESLDTVEARLQNIKDSIAVLEVNPRDIYVHDAKIDPKTGTYLRRPMMSGSLPSNSLSPIVESMALYFMVQACNENLEEMNRERWQTCARLVSEARFPNEFSEEGERFHISGDRSQFSLPVFFGNNENPTDAFRKLGYNQTQFGNGISPFGNFQIDFRSLNLDTKPISEILHQTSELMLVFHVKYRSSREKLEWLDEK